MDYRLETCKQFNARWRKMLRRQAYRRFRQAHCADYYVPRPEPYDAFELAVFACLGLLLLAARGLLSLWRFLRQPRR